MQTPRPRLEFLGGRKYRLLEDFTYRWQHAGSTRELTVPKDFECDAASVPRLLWSYVHPLDIYVAAVAHDWVYAYAGHIPQDSYRITFLEKSTPGPLPWTRKEADKLFARIMRERGVSVVKRRLAYLAVRAFGWLPWKRNRKALTSE